MTEQAVSSTTDSADRFKRWLLTERIEQVEGLLMADREVGGLR